MSKNNDDDDEDVGYKKPPKNKRFEKNGPSPNPGGRPKKRAVSFDELVIERLEARVAHSEHVVIEHIVNTAIKCAAQGDMRALKFLCESYIVAKSRRQSARSDEDTDREAAKRIFSLDPRSYTDVTDQDDATEDDASSAPDKSDDDSDG